MNAHGIDISVWQDDDSTPQMFDPIRARKKGCSFVGIKVSQGDWEDKDYTMNWRNCKNWLYRMPYHFLTWDVPPRKQAEIFWSLIEKDPGELPLIADFEWWKVTPPDAMDRLYNFTYRLKQLCDPLPRGVYTALTFWKEHGSTAAYWKELDLWLCDIAGAVDVPAPWESWTFHQYTFKLDGIAYGAESKDLDGDWYNGTLDQMISRYGLEALHELEGPAKPEPKTGMRMKVIASTLNVRSGPATSYQVIRKLRIGDQVDVLGLDGSNVWVEVAPGEWACYRNANGKYMEIG